MKIGIDGLPLNAASLLPGRLYAMVSEQKDILRQVMGDTLSTADRCGLVSAEATENYLRGDCLSGWQSGRLQALRLSLSKRTPSHRRTERLLAELEHFDFDQCDLLVIDPAEGLLNLRDLTYAVTQIEVYQAWAERHQLALILVYGDLLLEPDCLNNLMACADRFSGLVRLARESGQMSWKLLHWFSHQGMQGKVCYALSAQVGGRGMQVDGGCLLDKESVQTVEISSALDDDLVYVVSGAVSDARDIPRRWKQYETIELMQESAVDVVNASMILDYGANSDFPTLAKQIFSLRNLHGNGVKLVVRETSAVIRHYHEQLLLRLGCNLVVPSAVGFARFVSMLDSLQGQVFNRQLDDDYESVITTVSPSEEVGYLPAADFVSSVSKTLEATAVTGVQSAMIQLNILPGVGVANALRLCRLRRPGDICTAVGDAVFLFLFACRESDVSLALDHVIELPVVELYVDQVRHSDSEDILLSIQSIKSTINDDSPDYTEALQFLDEDRMQDTVEETVQLNDARQTVFQASQPIDAVARPLSLKVG